MNDRSVKRIAELEARCRAAVEALLVFESDEVLGRINYMAGYGDRMDYAIAEVLRAAIARGPSGPKERPHD